jgi:predicted extracellular nuclease
VTFPVAAADTLERFEGMIVRLPQEMTVTEHFQLGRFGQVVLAQGGRLQQPTNILPPGPAAQDLQAQNTLRRIILDDASQAQNPDPILFARGGQPLSASNTLRGGDTATGIVGVLGYTWAGNAASGNAYRVRPVGSLGGSYSFVAANPRPSAAPEVGGSIRVTGLNLLNYYNTFDGLPDNVDNCRAGLTGPLVDCRGADTQAEFDRQWPKTVAAILAADPDVLGINEIENDGYGPDSAIADLVTHLNDATSPGTYAFIDADAATGQVDALGPDAIKVGMLYKPGVVTPVGTTAVLNTTAFMNGGDSAFRTRPSLAQAFEVNATQARFIVDANHLKSKGSACDAPDAGDLQGNCVAVRVAAANELVSWLATDPTGTGDPDILLIGDYNSYAREDPIAVLEGAGFTNLVRSLLGEDAYSFVFDGQWGYLDQALASGTLTGQVAGVADFHINADEPSVLDYNTDFKTANLQASLYAADMFRVSDHDPVLVGLELQAAPAVATPVVTPEPSEEGQGAVASATFSQPEAIDTYTCTVDYGDGTPVVAGTVTGSTCTGPSHEYATYGTYTVTVTVTDDRGRSGSASVGHSVIFAFDGFYAPIDNAPILNAMKAGAAVPVKFSLGGDRGMAIVAAGSPMSRTIPCAASTSVDGIEETSTAGASGLQYDPATGLYTYVWKTSKAWAGTCRELTLTLVDGTTHVALFTFTR